MISDPGNKVTVKRLSNFHHLKTQRGFPYAGTVGSHAFFALPLHSWVYKQGWWHLNIPETPLWTQIWWPQQGAPSSLLAFPMKEIYHSMDRKPVLTDICHLDEWPEPSWKENFLLSSIVIYFCNLKIDRDFSYWEACCFFLSIKDFIYSWHSPEQDSHAWGIWNWNSRVLITVRIFFFTEIV